MTPLDYLDSITTDNISNKDLNENLSFTVSPLHKSVPLGAPVRINIELANRTKYKILVPKLSMKAGLIKGVVIDPSGTRRSFLPLEKCLDKEELIEIYESQKHSITLLRGGEG